MSHTALARVAGTLFVASLCSSVVHAQDGWRGVGGGEPIGTNCQQLNFPPTSATTGSTSGVLGSFAPGDHVTLTVALITATTSSVGIVGSPAGTPVLAGPLIGAGSISYDVTGPLPAGAGGIGFFVNSVSPSDTTITVSMSCTEGVPVWPPVMFALAAVTMLGAGVLSLRRRGLRLG